MTKFPDVPTVKESGFRITHLTPLGLAGPRGLAPEIVNVLDEGFRKSMNDPAFIGVMEEMENPPLYLGPEGYAKAWAESTREERERGGSF
jgi:tripartite-type tricarboxylate transporter receptor subunit TctC